MRISRVGTCQKTFELYSKANTCVPVIGVYSCGRLGLLREIIPFCGGKVKERYCGYCLISIYHDPKAFPHSVPTPHHRRLIRRTTQIHDITDYIYIAIYPMHFLTIFLFVQI